MFSNSMIMIDAVEVTPRATRRVSDKIVRCPFVPSTLSIPDVDFGSTLFLGLLQHPAAMAMTNCSTGETISHLDFSQRAESVAARLLAHGFHKGDVVAIFAPNSIDWMLVAAAAFRIGGAVASVNCLLTSDELAQHITLCGAGFIYTTTELSSLVMTAIQQQTRIKRIFTNSLTTFGIHLPTDRPSNDEHLSPLPSFQQLDIQSQDVALVMFSSGTTGPQKAVLLSHRNLVSTAQIFTHPLVNRQSGKVLVSAPFCHMQGFCRTMVALAHGDSVIFAERFFFEMFLRAIEDHQITKIGVVPPVATLLAKSPEVERHNVKLSEITCGSAPLSSEVEDLLMQRFPGVQIRQGYGLTETTASVLFVPDSAAVSKCNQKRHPGSVGVPVHNVRVKVLDVRTGATLGPNQEGEMCIQSPTMMLGYAQNPKATAETIDKDGWLHSGDIGYYDEDGYFYIVDRIKELIKYNAYQVAPAELEAVLLSHPQVADAGVIGIPDLSAGELPMAWVVKKCDSSTSEKDIQDYVASKVAPYKALRGGVRFVATIPKTASGKILRRNMRAAVMQGRM